MYQTFEPAYKLSVNLKIQCGIKNKAAIALQSKSNVKLIAALLFIPYSSPI